MGRAAGREAGGSGPSRSLTKGPAAAAPRRGFAGCGASQPRWPRSVPARPGSGCAPGAGLQLGKSEYGEAGGSAFARGSSAGFPLSCSPLSFGRGASAAVRFEPARRGAAGNRGGAAGLQRFPSRGPAPPGPGSRCGRPSEPSVYGRGAAAERVRGAEEGANFPGPAERRRTLWSNRPGRKVKGGSDGRGRDNSLRLRSGACLSRVTPLRTERCKFSSHVARSVGGGGRLASVTVP